METGQDSESYTCMTYHCYTFRFQMEIPDVVERRHKYYHMFHRHKHVEMQKMLDELHEGWYLKEEYQLMYHCRPVYVLCSV